MQQNNILWKWLVLKSYFDFCLQRLAIDNWDCGTPIHKLDINLYRLKLH